MFQKTVARDVISYRLLILPRREYWKRPSSCVDTLLYSTKAQEHKVIPSVSASAKPLPDKEKLFRRQCSPEAKSNY